MNQKKWIIQQMILLPVPNFKITFALLINRLQMYDYDQDRTY